MICVFIVVFLVSCGSAHAAARSLTGVSTSFELVLLLDPLAQHVAVHQFDSLLILLLHTVSLLQEFISIRFGSHLAKHLFLGEGQILKARTPLT